MSVQEFFVESRKTFEMTRITFTKRPGTQLWGPNSYHVLGYHRLHPHTQGKLIREKFHFLLPPNAHIFFKFYGFFSFLFIIFRFNLLYLKTRNKLFGIKKSLKSVYKCSRFNLLKESFRFTEFTGCNSMSQTWGRLPSPKRTWPES